MAIKFVDKGPEDEADRKATPIRQKSVSQPSLSTETPVASTPPADDDKARGTDAANLPYPKPEPKVRGRRAAPAVAATDVAPAQVALEGLLPNLPHAKPEPKPRGRKKAFG